MPGVPGGAILACGAIPVADESKAAGSMAASGAIWAAASGALAGHDPAAAAIISALAGDVVVFPFVDVKATLSIARKAPTEQSVKAIENRRLRKPDSEMESRRIILFVLDF